MLNHHPTDWPMVNILGSSVFLSRPWETHVFLVQPTAARSTATRLFEQGGLQEDLDIEAFPTALESEAHMLPAASAGTFNPYPWIKQPPRNIMKYWGKLKKKRVN